VSIPNAYCPTCRHRDDRTGRCRDLDEPTSPAPIRCTAYDGPPLDDEEPATDEEET
jgi:hypothetical protein